jgi:hypothetical protein
MEVKDTFSAVASANKEAIKDSGKIIAGNIINNRLEQVIVPKLPLMVRGYASTPLGRAALANVIAGVIIHTMPTNDKAILAAECMIQSASLELASSFNIEEMINDLLDGVPGLEPTAEV